MCRSMGKISLRKKLSPYKLNNLLSRHKAQVSLIWWLLAFVSFIMKLVCVCLMWSLLVKHLHFCAVVFKLQDRWIETSCFESILISLSFMNVFSFLFYSIWKFERIISSLFEFIILFLIMAIKTGSKWLFGCRQGVARRYILSGQDFLVSLITS